MEVQGKVAVALTTVVLAGAAVLLVAGISKIAAPCRLASGLDTVFGMRRSGATAIVRIFGFVEIVIASALSSGWGTRWAAVATGAAGSSILGFCAMAWSRRLRIQCGCFGGLSSSQLGVKNVLFGATYVLLGGYLSIAGWHSAPGSVANSLNAVLTTYCCSLFIVLTQYVSRVTPVLGRGLAWRWAQ